MNPKHFENSTAGKLVSLGQGEGAYQAFVPNPLPPDVTLDLELVKVLSAADRALGELAGLGRTMTNPQLLISPFVSREAVLSSRIEGTQADISDLYQYRANQQLVFGLADEEAKESETAANADVQEVNNYVKALEYGLERLNTLPISQRLLREVHERLMTGVRGERAKPGEFRQVQNWIGRPGSKIGQAEYVPPPIVQMEQCLTDLETFIHAPSDYPELLRIAMIHYQFEAIHPFIDGNGRIGRVLISLLLVSWNLLPAPLLYLSAYFERHRNDYYDLLQAVSEQGKWKEWFLFFLDGVNQESRDASRRAKELQDLQAKWHNQLRQERSRISALTLDIIDSLFVIPVISATILAKQFAVTQATARKAIQRLVEMAILMEVDADAKRNRWYYSTDIVKIVS